ncbi:MAG: ExbD/TolR family protein [Planctomycetota bacterium]|jgi:biopolymer transport protein ExbD
MAAEAIREQVENASADSDLTPMIDVAFLIIIFFMCLPFKTLDGKLAAFLPTNKGIHVPPDVPPELFFVKVHVVGRDEVERAWGPRSNRSTVSAPTRVLYRFEDGRTTDSLNDVAAHIRRIRDATEKIDRAELRGEVKAARKVPHKFVVAVLNKFTELGLDRVDFYGTEIPGKRTLDASSLPYPGG